VLVEGTAPDSAGTPAALQGAAEKQERAHDLHRTVCRKAAPFSMALGTRQVALCDSEHLVVAPRERHWPPTLTPTASAPGAP
jgi:hypothetical protein